jgi:integrase
LLSDERKTCCCGHAPFQLSTKLCSPLRESNWERSVVWSAATTAAGLHGFRVHDLRHTAASIWLAAGTDPKVVKRVLGHATASMTMDLYGHLVDGNLWQAADRRGHVGDICVA